MFTNKASDGLHNLCGEVIMHRRKEMGKSQRQLADMLQIAGLDIDKNAIQRIEARKRFVTDIELTYFSRVMNLPYEALLCRPTDTD